MTEFESALEFAKSIVSKPNPTIPLGDLARQFLKAVEELHEIRAGYPTLDLIHHPSKKSKKKP